MLLAKTKVVVIMLALRSFACAGQTYKIEDSSWISDIQSVDQIETTKEIGLALLRIPIDSLTKDFIIWHFQEKLTVTRYDPNSKHENKILTCDYSTDPNKALVYIHWPTGVTVYRYGFVSTGNYVLLIKKKKV